MEGRGRRMHGWRDTEREGWKQMDKWWDFGERDFSGLMVTLGGEHI